eukprot:1442209-Amphidinium_carterae.1
MRSGDWLPTPYDRVAMIQNLLRIWYPYGDLSYLPHVHLAQLLVAAQYAVPGFLACSLHGKKEHPFAALGRCSAIPLDYCYQIWKIARGEDALVSAGPVMMTLSGWLYATFGPVIPFIVAIAWYTVTDGKQHVPQNSAEET